MPKPGTYLGDGLYATHDNTQIELYAYNGVRKTDQVFLEPSTLGAFLAYIEQLHHKATDA